MPVVVDATGDGLALLHAWRMQSSRAAWTDMPLDSETSAAAAVAMLGHMPGCVALHMSSTAEGRWELIADAAQLWARQPLSHQRRLLLVCR